MASWNSFPLLVSYEVLGWLTFVCWSFSFYPQVLLNYRRKRFQQSILLSHKCEVHAFSPFLFYSYLPHSYGCWKWLLDFSVVGLNFDFVLLNFTKHLSYLSYNASLYFSRTVQKQYKDKYGQNEMIPVAANDVAFSSHAVLLTATTLFQIAIYERGDQKLSKIACGIVSIVWLIVAICFFKTLSTHHWLWLLSVFNFIQVCLTTIKYIPQAVMNFMRKSTEGWSIENTLLDFSGSVGNYAQMVTQSIDQGSWMNIYGNLGKVMLSLISISFDVLFMIQHFLLYRHKKGPNTKTAPEVEMVKPIDRPMELELDEMEIEEIEKMPLVP